MARYPAPIPASFFGMVLGLVGLGDCWRVAHKAWDLPKVVGETVMITGFVVWVILVLLYIGKWLFARAEARAELAHPIQSCFIGLSGVATMLAGIAIAPYARTFAVWLFVIGASIQLIYGVYFTGKSWQGDRELGVASPALYLPTVAGNFVSAFAAGYFGYATVGYLFLGAGALSWLSLESQISHRMSFYAAMPLPLRPTLGIMLAPPVVGLIGLLFVTGGVEGEAPTIFAYALLGYGLLQLLFLIRTFPLVAKQPFGAGYWAYSFGITALAFDAIVFVIREGGSPTGYIQPLAAGLFVFANVALALLIVGTLWRLVTAKLMPAPLVQA